MPQKICELGSPKLCEWKSVREAFVFDLLESFLTLYDQDPEDKQYKAVEAAASYEDLVQIAHKIEVDGQGIPVDLLKQAAMSDADFKQMLTDLIPQTDLLLHKAGHKFLTDKINQGLTGPDVAPAHAAVIFDILDDQAGQELFFGRIHFMITQPIDV